MDPSPPVDSTSVSRGHSFDRFPRNPVMQKNQAFRSSCSYLIPAPWFRVLTGWAVHGWSPVSFAVCYNMACGVGFILWFCFLRQEFMNLVGLQLAVSSCSWALPLDHWSDPGAAEVALFLGYSKTKGWVGWGQCWNQHTGSCVPAGPSQDPYST